MDIFKNIAFNDSAILDGLDWILFSGLDSASTLYSSVIHIKVNDMIVYSQCPSFLFANYLILKTSASSLMNNLKSTHKCIASI